MNEPKVSIIVPVYNVERYLERCVTALRKQTLKDIEIILVDDGSPDKCPLMCNDFARFDTRIKVVHKKNEGLGMACNSGIEASTGDFIAFCDSDDWVDMNCYETLYNTAIEYNADAVYSGIKRIDENGIVTPMSQSKTIKVFEDAKLIDFAFDMIAASPERTIERERQMSAKIVLYSGEIIRKYQLQFHSERNYISEDLLFNLDFLNKCSLVVEIPKTFYYYFFNSNSLCNTLRADRFEKNKFLREYLLTQYDFHERNIEFTQRVNRMFIGYVRNIQEHIVHAQISKSQKYKLMNEICSDSIWGKLIKEYPIETLSIPKKIIFWFTYLRLPVFINLIYRLKYMI